jgi:hypothetical protein
MTTDPVYGGANKMLSFNLADRESPEGTSGQSAHGSVAMSHLQTDLVLGLGLPRYE